jgi:hypothetical protein
MRDLTEAPDSRKGRPHIRRLAPSLFLAALLLSAGCTSSPRTAASVATPPGIDPTSTASITPLSADADLLSDEPVIARAISAAADGARPLSWSNPETGATGVISSLSALTGGDLACRTFHTTRHGFDGVALYKGRACRLADGRWHLASFGRADE